MKYNVHQSVVVVISHVYSAGQKSLRKRRPN